MTTSQIVTNATVGVAASVGSVITSFQEHLEWSVRFAGSAVGLVIAIISLYRLIRNRKKL